MILSGKVCCAEFCNPLHRVSLRIYDNYDKVIDETYSDEYGVWTLKIAQDCVSFKLVFSKTGYVSKFYNGCPISQPVRLLENKLIGYQNKLWFQPGENVDVYVYSPVEFDSALFRHGFDKEKIIQFKQHSSQTQQVPDGFFVESGIGWELSFAYRIPENARPGIYSLLLKTKNETFAIPMLVTTPIGRQRAKLLVLSSNTTWQSYNLWGGRSRYRNYEEQISSEFIDLGLKFRLKQQFLRIMRIILPGFIKKIAKTALKKKTQNEWVFKKLTMARPFTNCDLEDETVLKPFTNHLAAGEWRILAWLEREKIDYDVVSGFDLHNHSSILQNYRGIIFSTHCEYWSKEMYKAVKKHHEKNRLWILNLGGNTMYREIEFFDDGSTKCASLSFEKSVADETQLLGVRFKMADYGSCAPYKIIRPDHWVYDGAPVNKLTRKFGGLSLNQNTAPANDKYNSGRPGAATGLLGMGASGWETDKLSKTAPNDFKIVAKGLNKNGGADMVIRELQGDRGGVFSASSITFGGCLLVDSIASCIVKNVIKKVSS